MKKLLNLVFLLQFYGMHATWVAVGICNQSDLQFTQAARNNDVEIQSITKKIEASQCACQVSIDKSARFGTQGNCKIIAKTPRGEVVSIRFLGGPTNRVANGRAEEADKDSRKAAGLNNKGMMARIMLDIQGVKKLIGYYCGYEKENQPFNLVIKGSDGNYQAVLTPADVS